MVTIPQRPSEEEVGVESRDEEMEEEKGDTGTRLRSYIEKNPAAVKIHSGWINKSIHHHHHSTARHAKYTAHAKRAKQGAQRLWASIMILRHWGVLHIEKCEVLQA